jgi:hypothetical protein
MLHNQGSSREAAIILYCAFSDASLVDLGIAISVIIVLLASMSAAQRAAPTEKQVSAGTIAKRR